MVPVTNLILIFLFKGINGQDWLSEKCGRNGNLGTRVVCGSSIYAQNAPWHVAIDYIYSGKSWCGGTFE